MMELVSMRRGFKFGWAGVALLSLAGPATMFGQAPGNAATQRQFLDRYCVTCHSDKLKTAGLSLSQADVSKPGEQTQIWEKVLRKVHTGVMPPPVAPQPPAAERSRLPASSASGASGMEK